MKIIVFGATGRVVACAVDQDIQSGHDVTAFVCDRQWLKVGGNQVSIAEMDGLNEASVRLALAPGAK